MQKQVMFSLMIVLAFTACNNDNETVKNASTTVTVVDGYIKDSVVKDTAGQVGVYSSNGQYSFTNSLVYPLSTSGGIIEATGATFDIIMSAQEGSIIISPITTFLENDSNLLVKLANLGLGFSTFSEFAVDYVKEDNEDLAKLAQVLYLAQKNASLLTEFKTKLALSSPASLNDLYTRIQTDINTKIDAANIFQYQAFLTKVKSLNGSVSTYESSLKKEKYDLGIDFSNVTHKGITYETVISPYTGKVWLDRDLGASQVCITATDANCYGDYYQWGRSADGHEKFNSLTTNVLYGNLSGGVNFVTNSSSPYDWTTADINGGIRSANWSKLDGSSVCPVGFRVPSITELNAETNSLNTANLSAFDSFLKLAYAGFRQSNNVLLYQGQSSFLRTISINGIYTSITSGSNTAIMGDYFLNGQTHQNITGINIRCIRD
ncbi:MAG: hypothetical protein COA44_07135 [Arcobacter sp.]|nr:MAG: hypothetical protein COA44_07135 [Arcobacter sp.]